MNKLSIFTIALMVILPQIAMTQPSTIINLPNDSKNYNVNFSDNYSLATRSATYVFKYAKVSEISNILQKNISRYGSLSVNEALNMIILCDETDKLNNLLQLCQQIDQPRMVDFTKFALKRFDLKYLSPDRIGNQLLPFLSPDGRIQTDFSFNAIWVYDHPSRIDEINSLLASYDLPMKQILIDVEIIEISTQGLQDNGLNWDELLLSTSISSNVDYSKAHALSELVSKASGTVSNWSAGSTAGINIQQLRNLVRLLSEKGIAKIATTPKLLTLNNTTSNIWYGKDIKRFPSPVPASPGNINLYSGMKDRMTNMVMERSDSVISPSNQYYSSRDYIRDYTRIYDYSNNSATETNRMSGLDLSITPSIGSSNLFNLSISCELTDLVGWTEDKLPLIQGQSLRSQVIVKDNESFLLGQLSKKTKITKTSKVPGLGTILPFLFSRKVTAEDDLKILILLTPHAIDIDNYGLSDKTKTDLLNK